MKYLSDYTQQGITDALNKFGGFFAFSNTQLDEQKKEGVTYVNCGAGLICPKENAKDLLQAIEDAHAAGIKQDIEENGKDKIIERELRNHEAFYTYEIDDTVSALSGYGFTEEDVMLVFRKVAATIED